MKRRSIVSSLVLFLLLLLLTTGALAAETGAVTASGTCGANLTWSLDSAGTLTISGTGAMEDYYIDVYDLSGTVSSKIKYAPWHSQCSSIKTVYIGDEVTSIGDWAFYECDKLTEIVIPDGVIRIGVGSFYNCKNIISITLPDKIRSIPENAFTYCSSLIAFNIPYGVTCIDKEAFASCSNLISIVIPNTVTDIGNRAFNYCSSLVSVSIPNSVTSIKNFAFAQCSNLRNISIPSSVSSIGRGAFSGCQSLISIVIPDEVTLIEAMLFSGCSSLTHIELPNILTSIGERAFQDCRNLSAITIPDSVTIIGSDAFRNCESLTCIEIPKSTTKIDSSAFSRCSNLTTVVFSGNISCINSSAFYDCKKLTSVFVTNIRSWCNIAFEYDTSNPLYYAKNLYLNGVKLETLEIPSGVQVIKEHAFVNAECLTAVSIPKSVIGIAAGAFAGCTNIQRVYYEGSKADWEGLPISADNDALKKADIYYNATPSDYYCTVTCAVSPGGTVTVDKNTYASGETVTVTAKPFSGYRLDTILVDGTAISGNTFTAAKNHTVSAVFEKLPVSGGDETFRIGDISVCTASGEALAAIPKGECLATIPVTNLSAPGSVTVMIACYTAAGQYQGMTFVGFENVPTGAALKVTTPISNSGGTIAGIKAFIVKSPFDITPVGNAVVFGL